jgi:O-antigen/teichoic acid export membrane protein
VFCGLVGTLFITIAILFPSFLAPLLPLLPLVYVWVVIVVGICLIVRNTFQSLLLVNNHMFNYGAVFVLWGAVLFVLDFVLIVLCKFGFQAAIIALVISTGLAALWALTASWKLNGISFRPSLKVFGMSWHMGMRASWAVLGMFLMINIHAFAIDSLAGKAAVALFSVCFRIFQLFQRAADVTGVILYSHVAQHEEKTGLRMTMLVHRNVIFFSLLFVSIGGLLGKPIILIISKSAYMNAYIPLLLMLPGIIFINAGSVINTSYWGRGYPSKIIHAPFFAAGAGFVLDVLLMPIMGLNGAALSFSIIGVLWFMYVIALFCHDSGYRLDELVMPRYEDFLFIWSRIKRKFIRNKP